MQLNKPHLASVPKTARGYLFLTEKLNGSDTFTISKLARYSLIIDQQIIFCTKKEVKTDNRQTGTIYLNHITNHKL